PSRWTERGEYSLLAIGSKSHSRERNIFIVHKRDLFQRRKKSVLLHEVPTFSHHPQAANFFHRGAARPPIFSPCTAFRPTYCVKEVAGCAPAITASCRFEGRKTWMPATKARSRASSTRYARA